jgi:hypothetical protein
MTEANIKAMAEAALDVAKPRWRDIERAKKTALLRAVEKAMKATLPVGEEADEV